MATGTASKKKTSRKPRATKATQDAKKQMWAVVLFALGLLLAALTFIEGDKFWKVIHDFLFGLFGCSTYFWAPLLVYAAVIATMDKPLSSVKAKVWQVGILIVVLSGAFAIFGPGLPDKENFVENVITLYEMGVAVSGGGLAGALLGWPLTALFGKVGASIIVVLLIFVFVMLITGSTLIGLFRAARKPVENLEETYAEHVREREERLAEEPAPSAKELRKAEKAAAKAAKLAAREGEEAAAPSAARFNIDVDISGDTVVASEGGLDTPAVRVPKKDSLINLVPDSPIEYIAPPQAQSPFQDEEEARYHPLDPDILQAERQEGGSEIGDRFQEDQDAVQPKTEALFGVGIGGEYPTETPPAPVPEAYKYPPLSLLKKGVGVTTGTQEELNHNAQLLVDTLKSFGVQTRITDICRGPSVTRYELQPSAGVKISKITGLADDIALNLAAAGIRIEAPIPNKAAVGIEVPNKVTSMVNIRDIIESSDFQASQGGLTVAMGKDIAGNITLANIAKMPHVLIAGATGSGKSVCINSIIISLLYKYSPDEVKLLMIDPKVVELGVYNGIPHLLVPVVTDPRKAAGALGWAVGEMMNRYKTFAAHGVKDLSGYNRLAEQSEALELMPKVVIIIDELADLMMVASGEVEDAICRLAQMARAAGMHLVIATQRPSVDVITGIIKANIPSRIAFAVSSMVDSRTILDMGGAEKLLGRGDMLFYPVGVSKPMRVQGCFVTENEVESAVGFIKENEPVYDESILEDIDRHAAASKGGKGSRESAEPEGSEDEMLPQAIECVVESGQASTSQLQRRLKLGYARAARIIDQLEQKGIVGPFEGSKPRQVLLSKERYMEMRLQGAETAVLNSQTDPKPAEAPLDPRIFSRNPVKARPDEFEFADL